MKKTTFLLVFIVLFLGEPFAQDTVQIRDMRLISRYFVPDWPDSFYHDTIKHDTLKDEIFLRGSLVTWAENLSKAKEEALYMYTDDTLQVYGIAASLSTMWRLYPDSYVEQIQEGTLDTSCEFMYTYLRLYEADPDSLRHIGDELLVNLRYTPVSYYVNLAGLIDGYVGDYTNLEVVYFPTLPIYERYFSAPVTVADSFYVGRRYRPDHHDGRDVVLIHLADSLYHGTKHKAIYFDFTRISFGEPDTVVGWKYQIGGPRTSIPFLFPILAPPDTSVSAGDTTVIIPGDTIIVPGDTIINGGDTIINPGDTIIIPGDTINPGVGLQPNDLIYRYTNVAPNPARPNPARNSVRITSSFGISRIEAYDLRGRRIYESPQLSTFSFPLSTIDWPRGTYLLRITTPAGTTTKKLLIQ